MLARRDGGRLEKALAAGADVIAMRRGARANTDYPKVIDAQRGPQAFDSVRSWGQPANIKELELAFGTAV